VIGFEATTFTFGVAQSGERPRLTLEAFQSGWIGRQFRWQLL
jgi:hypothetical protein